LLNIPRACAGFFSLMREAFGARDYSRGFIPRAHPGGNDG
jgi:hypothetical protein